MRQLYTSLVVAILLGVCPVGAAVAADQDFAKITCKDFVNASEEQMGMMLMWIDGYMSGKSDNTIINDAWLEKLGMHMARYCTANGGNSIIQAMEAMKE